MVPGATPTEARIEGNVQTKLPYGRVEMSAEPSLGRELASPPYGPLRVRGSRRGACQSLRAHFRGTGGCGIREDGAIRLQWKWPRHVAAHTAGQVSSRRQPWRNGAAGWDAAPPLSRRVRPWQSTWAWKAMAISIRPAFDPEVGNTSLDVGPNGHEKQPAA